MTLQREIQYSSTQFDAFLALSPRLHGNGTYPLTAITNQLTFNLHTELINKCLFSCFLRCSKNLERRSENLEMKRRRMKASISSPSPLPDETQQRRMRGDSGSSGFVEGMESDLHKYGMAATTFLSKRESGGEV